MDNGNSGELSLGDLFQASGLAPEDVQVIRHTLKPDGLKTRADAMGPGLLPYVREQGIRNSTYRYSPLLRPAARPGVRSPGGPAGDRVDEGHGELGQDG